MVGFSARHGKGCKILSVRSSAYRASNDTIITEESEGAMSQGKKIFLTGGSGFIGRHVLEALSQGGHEVTALLRGQQMAWVEQMQWPGVRCLAGDFTQTASWESALQGQDIVINLVGIIREQGKSRFDVLHQAAPIALFDAAKRAGVKKIIQLSALGADDGAQSRYHRSKRAADQHLATLGIPYVVLRPSFVYGPQDHSMTFFTSLAALPVTPVVGDGSYLVQPVHVDDLVQAIVQAVEREDVADIAVDVGGAEAMSFNAMLDTLAVWLGKRSGAFRLHLPLWWVGFLAWMTDLLGGRGPISRDELGMLLRGNHCDNALFVQTFGFVPTAFALGIARRPRSLEARWTAYLTPSRLVVQWSIAFIWIATGVVSAWIYPEQESLKLLAGVGLTGMLAKIALYGTSYVEIVLGICTALGYRLRWMGALQLLLMFGFMVILTYGSPSFWVHPFGPLTKNIPLIAATLVMMAMAEADRAG